MARVLALVALACLGSCAATTTGGGCEQNDPNCRPDGPTADAYGFLDATHVDSSLPDSPNIPFGEACTDKFQCASRICIFSGISGYCSEICAAGSCPPGYGCYGVLGVIEPGQVSSVCVKDNNLLCTACSQSEECSTVARDLCLPSPTGGSFCARDCSTIECPQGYVCTDVMVQGTPFKQCLPASNACDCNVINAGAKKSCDIETPFGKCAGTRTCLGATGWSECQPPSTSDEPDGTFTDNDCDGVDGKLDGGIFVAKSGSDSAGCGLTYQLPCATINFGSQRAADVGRSWVYVQAGDYPETLVLRDGVNVAGGYDLDWQRDARTAPGHLTRISGQSYEDESIAVVARNLATQTKLVDVVIVPKAGSGARDDFGAARSSYGVHALNAFIRLERVTINQANGADGGRGGDGPNATTTSSTPGMNGTKGGNAHESGIGICPCDSSSRGAGGSPGGNSCGLYATGDFRAGRGGDGGVEDRECSGICPADDATPGATGNPAPVNGVGYGGPGSGGSGGDSCGPAGDAQNGRSLNGGGGGGGTGHGRVIEGKYWYAWPGGTGAVGLHGSGGGGGGGSGGCDIGLDSWGAGGGGGGVGGCAARGGGGGGKGGGGSFGIVGINSGIVVRDSTIIRANGGRGGDGGTGGQGQSGGLGNDGGDADGDSKAGGRGGNGGHGGHAGGGGGGAGGASHGAFWQGGAVDINNTNSISNSGDGGGGGNGGPSAPSAPDNERDGYSGSPGGTGPAEKLFSCGNPSGC